MSPGAAPGAVRASKAGLKSMVPRIVAKLRSGVLLMGSSDALFAFFGARVLMGPETASPTPGQPAVRWHYGSQVAAAAGFWHIARGRRAVFGAEWSPRMGVL